MTPGNRLGPYEFVAPLGAGGMGEFWRARDAGHGRWIAYLSAEAGRPEICVAAFPGRGGKRQVSTAGRRQPKWRADGKELFHPDLGGQLMAVPIRMNGGFETGTPQPLFTTSPRRTNIPQYDVFPDGKRFVVNSIVTEKASTPTTLVQNWAPESR